MSKQKTHNEIVHVWRTVIENKLLDCIHDKDCVAAIFSKPDLDVLIDALEAFRGHPLEPGTRYESLLEGLTELREGAFPA